MSPKKRKPTSRMVAASSRPPAISKARGARSCQQVKVVNTEISATRAKPTNCAASSWNAPVDAVQRLDHLLERCEKPRPNSADRASATRTPAPQPDDKGASRTRARPATLLRRALAYRQGEQDIEEVERDRHHMALAAKAKNMPLRNAMRHAPAARPASRPVHRHASMQIA